MERDYSEGVIRDFLFQILCDRIGKMGTMRGEAKVASFKVKGSFGGGICSVEGALDYTLPTGSKHSHKNDILIETASGKYIVLEVKFLSSVPDQFKARSFDILNLKRTFGKQLVGIMVYLHVPRAGISAEQAHAICYPFDHFFGLEARDSQHLLDLVNPGNLEKWEALLKAVEAELTGPS